MTTSLPASVLTKHQMRKYGPKPITGYGPGAFITATVRYDDQCGNGCNTFSITADIVTPASKRRNDIHAGGCLHEDISRTFPDLAPLIKWHLVSSDGPMHYVANTVFHAKTGRLDSAQSTAVWPDATLEQLMDADALDARLPALMADFKAAVESLGFTY